MLAVFLRRRQQFVLGLDGDGPEVFDTIEQFVDEASPFDVQITVPDFGSVTVDVPRAGAFYVVTEDSAKATKVEG